MKKLIRAITELLEAKAELLREEAATLHLGTYARGYKDAQEDSMEGYDVVFVDETSDEDD